MFWTYSKISWGRSTVYNNNAITLRGIPTTAPVLDLLIILDQPYLGGKGGSAPSCLVRPLVLLAWSFWGLRAGPYLLSGPSASPRLVIAYGGGVVTLSGGGGGMVTLSGRKGQLAHGPPLSREQTAVKTLPFLVLRTWSVIVYQSSTLRFMFQVDWWRNTYFIGFTI